MITVDLSNPDLWSKKYLPAVTRPKTYNLLWGGAGSGKSQQIIQFLLSEIANHTENTYQTYFVIRKVASTIRNSVFQDFINKISDWGIGSIVDPKPGLMEIRSGTNRIVFLGCDNPEKLKSLSQAKYIWVEEATELTLDDWTQITLRLRGKSKTKKRFFLTFNPISDSHWIKKFFFDERHKLEEDSVLDIHATYLDNLDKLDSEYVKRMDSLKLTYPTMYQIYALGEWGVWDRENLFAQYFNEGRHVVAQSIGVDKRYPLYLSFDFNVKNTCVVAQHLLNGDTEKYYAHINVIKVFRHGDLAQLCQMIRQEFPKMLYVVNGDPAGNSRNALTMNNLSAYNIIRTQLDIPVQSIQVTRSAPSHLATKFISDLVFQKCVVWIQKDAAKELITDLKEAKVDRLVSLDPWKKKNPDKSHALDAWRYYVFNNFRAITESYNLAKLGLGEISEKEFAEVK